MKLILVTGATGFLGKHLVGQLKRAEESARIRILCRSATPWDRDAQIEIARGDITSPEDVFRAAEGMQEIYHLAGIVSRDTKDQELLYRTHIEGTRNVCEAARKHSARKVVVVSSSGTIAVSREPTIHDENSGYKNDVVAEWPYYLSKIFAEKLALNYFTQFQLPVVIASPSLLLGPGDDRNSSTGDVALFLEGQILAIPGGGLNFADARDVAAGLISAMRAGRPGERYLFGGPNWTFRELLEALAGITGRRAPKLQPSLRFSLASARILRAVYPLAGKEFKLDDASIKMGAPFWYCDSTKARRELGYASREPLETLRDTVDDLRSRGVA